MESNPSPAPARVVVVGDGMDRYRSQLGREGVDVRQVSTVEAATAAVGEGNVHCVVVSPALDEDAVDGFVDRLESHDPDLPVIVLTGPPDAVDGAGDGVDRTVETATASRDRSRRQRLDALESVARKLNRWLVDVTAESTVERTVCEALTSTGPYRFAWVGEAGADGVVHARAAAGEAEAYLETVRPCVDDDTEGGDPVGRTLRSGEPQVVRDVETDPTVESWRDAAEEHGFASVAAFPLTGGEVDGVLAVYSPVAHAFDGEELATLSELGGSVSAALATARTRSELATREAQYRTLVENLPGGGVALLDRDLRYTRVGGGVFEEIDLDPADLKGRLIGEVHSEGYLEAHRVKFEAGLDGKHSVFEFEYGGRSYQSRVVPVRTDGYVVGVMVLTVDVTERVERERALERSEKRFRALFEETLDALVLADDEGRYIDANPAACELYGLSRAELIGRTGAEFSAADFDHEAAWQSFLEAGAQRGEFELVRADGSKRTVEFVATTDIRPDEHLSTLRDVTERVERERTLAEQNERLDRFASIVSHDLRSPLSVAEGRLGLFRETGDEGHLDHVEDAIERTDRLVEDLLAVARGGREVQEAETVSVATVAREAWQTIDTGESTLVVDAERRVDADPSRLRQLFENLFRNAVEHGSASEPTARDAGDGAAPSSVEVRVLDTDSGFAVEDTGPGIAPEERERVFETGYTTGDEGTGLGLGIVEGIAGAHGWAIRVTEETNGGARFEITTDGERASNAAMPAREPDT